MRTAKNSAVLIVLILRTPHFELAAATNSGHRTSLLFIGGSIDSGR